LPHLSQQKVGPHQGIDYPEKELKIMSILIPKAAILEVKGAFKDLWLHIPIDMRLCGQERTKTSLNSHKLTYN